MRYPMSSHPDFVQCATERLHQIAWTGRLLQLATQSSDLSIDIDVQAEVFTSSIAYTVPASICCTLRSLNAAEIDVLRNECRCRSKTWEKIFMLQRKQSSSSDLSKDLVDYISDTTFDGSIVFVHVNDASDTSEGIKSSMEKPTLQDMVSVGVHGCTLVSNSVIHINSARVHKCGIISHTYIDAHSLVMNCGYIATQSPEDSFCQSGACTQSLKIMVGAESGGGRTLHLTPEFTMVDVSRQLSEPSCYPSTEVQPEDIGELNFIGSHCFVRDTPKIIGIYLHQGASIEAASFVQRVLLFPGSSICNGSTVRNAIIQWNGTISDGSSVTDAFFMEQAAAGPRSVVSNVVLGPDVHVSCGEIHVSVLGPNTNAHHQSLVIASLWPCGRGNVGYGANVGSNHTGRIPDQECCIGEGIFWGLSCVVKFPIDLSCAPYTIIAAGTTLAPQRCAMPFSLISNHSESRTCIVPGWLLRYSPYTIIRSEQKFSQRRKAIRHANYTGWNIFRPEIIALCWRAREALVLNGKSSSAIDKDSLYTNDVISGLGANLLTEKGRVTGIEAYTDCIQQFALEGLYSFLVYACSLCRQKFLLLPNLLLEEFRSLETPIVAPNVSIQWPQFPWDHESSSTAVWESQRRYLLAEFPWQPEKNGVVEWTLDLLDRHLELEQKYSDRVHQCKQRDDVRGIATIPDYAPSHILSADDPVVLSVQKNLDERMKDVQLLRQTISELVK